MLTTYIPKIKKRLYFIFKILLVLELILQTVSFSRYVYASVQRRVDLNRLYSQNWFFRNPESSQILKETDQLYAEYHPFLGWKYRPVELDHIRIKPDDTRKTAGDDTPITPSTKTVFFFGGSTGFGLFVKDEETIPSSLFYQLKRDNTPLFRILNYSQIGYTNYQEILSFITLLKQKSVPDLAIFYDGCNDLFVNAQTHNSGTRFNSYYEGRLRKLLGDVRHFGKREDVENDSIINVALGKSILVYATKYIKLISYPLDLINLIRNRQDSNTLTQAENPDEVVGRIVENYTNNAQLIETLSQQYHFDYILLWQPLIFNKKLTNDEALGARAGLQYSEDLQNFFSGIYRQTTAKLNSRKIKNFYDLTTAFENAGEKNLFFDDSCHIGAEGNSIVASIIKEIINTRIVHADNPVKK